MAKPRRKTDRAAEAVLTSQGVSRPAGPSDDAPDAESIRASLRDLVQTAVNYIDEEVSPDRAKATDYYKAKPLGNEEEGRSQVVMSTTRDSVLAIMPPLLRMFFGTDRAVEFVPKRPELAAQSEQESDYVTHLFADAPNAILEVNSSAKDGLVRRLGFVKWWAEPEKISQTYEQDGLSAEAVAVLAKDPEITYRVIGETPATADMPARYRCSISRQTTRMKICWGARPPENMFWNRTARSFQDAIMVGERREITVGEGVKLGFDRKELLDKVGSDESLRDNEENIARQPRDQSTAEDAKVADPSTWKLTLYEVYALLDEAGVGAPQLRRYWLAGDGYDVLKDPKADPKSPYLGVPVPEIPFACWCPDPEPHTIEGQSLADQTMDLQRVETALVRANLDSAGLAIHPRLAYQEGYANPHDVMNTEIGAVLRTTGRPADILMEFRHSYLGKELFPLMEWFKRIREERTGNNMESQGLNADALQSSTKEGVTATLTAAQARVEMMARFYAEQLLVPLFRGLRRLAKLHRQETQIVRMRGRFIETDPRTWDDDCEVRVKLMLGGGLPEQRLGTITAILARQEGLLQTLGPANPIVSVAQYTTALTEWAELSGKADPGAYFTKISDEQAQQIAQAAAQQPPKPDPQAAVAEAQVMLAQAQAQTLQQETQIKERELALKAEQQAFQQELDIEKLRQDFILKEKELELRYKRDLNEQEMRAFIEGQKAEDQRESDTADRMLKAKTDREKIAADTAAKIHATNAKPKPAAPAGDS